MTLLVRDAVTAACAQRSGAATLEAHWRLRHVELTSTQAAALVLSAHVAS